MGNFKAPIGGRRHHLGSIAYEFIFQSHPKWKKPSRAPNWNVFGYGRHPDWKLPVQFPDRQGLYSPTDDLCNIP